MNTLKRPICFDGEPETFTKEQVEAQIKGLKDNNAALLAEKSAIKKQMSDFQAQYEGIDPAAVKDMMSKFESDAELKLIAEGNITGVVSARTAKAIEAAEAKVAEAEAKVKLADERANQFSQKVLNDSIRAAAVRAGAHKYGIEDALLAGTLHFELDEKGNAIRREDGNIVMGADGKTPYGPDEWMAKMRIDRPNWFPADGNSGSSHSDGGAGNGGAKTMKRTAFFNLSPQEQAAKIKAGIRPID